MSKNVYFSLCEAKQKGIKKFVVLLDPDKLRLSNVGQLLTLAIEAKVDYFFVGGSLVVSNMLDECIDTIRTLCDIPVILFPGDISQISHKADAILFLSLISGRNSDLLIGRHVVAAPMLRKSKLEVLSTGYMLIDGGRVTTASYISGTTPIPSDKNEIAVCTAMAGEMLGNKLIYMDAGSGAKCAIPEAMISAVSRAVDIPLIIGGGIRTPEKVLSNLQAGADVIVVGNALESEPDLLKALAGVVHQYNNK